MHEGQEEGTGTTLLKGIFPTPQVFIENTLRLVVKVTANSRTTTYKLKKKKRISIDMLREEKIAII